MKIGLFFITLSLFFSSDVFADRAPKIDLNNLKASLEDSLNISQVTFNKHELDDLDDHFGLMDNLLSRYQLEFQFDRHGNVMTAKCFVRKNQAKELPSIYISCKTYNSDKKESPLFKDNEISILSNVLMGRQPLLKFETIQYEGSKPKSEREEPVGTK